MKALNLLALIEKKTPLKNEASVIFVWILLLLLHKDRPCSIVARPYEKSIYYNSCTYTHNIYTYTYTHNMAAQMNRVQQQYLNLKLNLKFSYYKIKGIQVLIHQMLTHLLIQLKLLCLYP